MLNRKCLGEAVYATRAAIEEGISAGGGSTYYRISEELFKDKDTSDPNMVGYTIVLEAIKEPFKQLCANCGITEVFDLEQQLIKSDKDCGYDFLREEIQKEFEHKITSMQKNLDRANIAVTDNGTRAKRLDLINSRLMTQTTTFKTLQSENEDVDLAEAATRLTTAQVTYEASLMATGKISQTSLLNYI